MWSDIYAYDLFVSTLVFRKDFPIKEALSISCIFVTLCWDNKIDIAENLKEINRCNKTYISFFKTQFIISEVFIEASQWKHFDLRKNFCLPQLRSPQSLRFLAQPDLQAETRRVPLLIVPEAENISGPQSSRMWLYSRHPILMAKISAVTLGTAYLSDFRFCLTSVMSA